MIGKFLRYSAPLFMALSSVVHARDRSPNVIVIFADDLGYGDLGCYGATKVKTPHIDQLASEGRRFTDAHAAASVCTPSRYALITGQYPAKGANGRGHWGAVHPNSQLIIPTDTFTIADSFKSKGYATGCIGKWHLGFKSGRNDWQEPLSPGPNDLGFDYYFGMPVVNSAPPYIYVENECVFKGSASDPLIYLDHKTPRTKEDPIPIRMPKLPHEAGQRTGNWYAGAQKAHEAFVEEEVAPTFTDKAIDWIDQHKESPFFLYLATTHIHHPFTPAPQFKGSSDAGLYGDFIQELDWMVGQITDALEQRNLTDNTIIVFTSDNGGMFNTGGQNAYAAGHMQNGNLLGFKFGIWEGGHRVPFIVKWPGHVPADSVSTQLISNVDLLATFSAIIGQDLTPRQQKDSVNMLPAFTEDHDSPIRESLVISPNKKQNLAIRKGKWIYIAAKGGGGWNFEKGHLFSGPPAISFIGKKNSEIVDGKIREDAAPAQLYNLETDLEQTTNLYHEHPEVVAELKALLEASITTP